LIEFSKLTHGSVQIVNAFVTDYRHRVDFAMARIAGRILEFDSVVGHVKEAVATGWIVIFTRLLFRQLWLTDHPNKWQSKYVDE
jgi:hypothetical protein